MKLGMPVLFEYNCVEDNLKLAKELNLDFLEMNLNFSYCRECLERDEVEDLFNKYNIDLICCGHVHGGSRWFGTGVIRVGSGAGYTVREP